MHPRNFQSRILLNDPGVPEKGTLKIISSRLWPAILPTQNYQARARPKILNHPRASPDHPPLNRWSVGCTNETNSEFNCFHTCRCCHASRFVLISRRWDPLSHTLTSILQRSLAAIALFTEHLSPPEIQEHVLAKPDHATLDEKRLANRLQDMEFDYARYLMNGKVSSGRDSLQEPIAELFVQIS